MTVDGILKSVMNQRDFSTINVRDYIHVVSAFSLSNWEYDVHEKQFKLCKSSSNSILCPAEEKAKSFIQRYDTMLQRLLRRNDFSLNCGGKRQLSAIKSVKGQTLKDPKMLFGMLSQIIEGEWYLEDPEDSIKLDFCQSLPTNSIFAETCFALVEGTVEADRFVVQSIRIPPIESAQVTKRLQSYPNPLHGAVKELESDQTLETMLRQHPEAYMVFLSDIWLDNNVVLTKLEELLEKMIQHPPASIVLLGRFLSSVSDDGPNAFTNYCHAFDAFARIINSKPAIKANTRFIFVPSSQDSFYPNILPRPSLPCDLFESFQELGIDHVLATNPCRIRVFNKDIVVSRSDIHSIMERARIDAIPEANGDVYKSLLDQSHLIPVASSHQLVQWNFDHALHLYPVPDVLCIGETLAPSSGSYAGCLTVNPGDFYRNALSYATYNMCRSSIELHNIFS